MNINKKFIYVLVGLFVILTNTIGVSANSQNEIKVAINGQQVYFDVNPTTINDRTMVPMRAIFENLGATVNWDGDTQTITSEKDGTKLQLTINSNIMYVNGVAKTLDAPATLFNGRTLVPVRAISEAFGYDVDWFNNYQTIGDSGVSDKIVSIVTDEEVMYQAFVNFIKNNGKYSDGKYSVSKDYEKYNHEKGTTDVATLTYTYDTSKTEPVLLLEYVDCLMEADESYIAEHILILIPKKSEVYQWMYTEQTSAPSFMQGIGKVRMTTEKFHKHTDFYGGELLSGKELWSGYLIDGAELMFTMIDIRANEIFVEKNSLLRFEYFGI